MAIVTEGHIGWVHAGLGWQAGVVEKFQASIRMDAEAGDGGAAGIGRVNIVAIIGEDTNRPLSAPLAPSR
jgi:hypothetical protein